MPRGVYDRSKAKKAREPKKASPHKTMAKSAANLVALPNAPLCEQFHILTDNLLALSQVRATLGGSPAAVEVEAEILAHVRAIKKLRQNIFGLAANETDPATVASVPQNGSVPLPSQPVVIPTPPNLT